MKLILIALLPLAPLACAMPLAAESPSTPRGDMLVYALSTSTLNSVFERQGYGRMFWTYNSSLKIVRNSSRSTLFLQNSFHDAVFRLDSHGDISKVADSRDGVYFPDDDASPFMVFGGGKIKIKGVGSLGVTSGEYVPIADPNLRNYARRCRKADGTDAFAIYARGTTTELVSDSGRAVYVESLGEDAILVVTKAITGKGYEVRDYRKTDRWQLTDVLNVPAPDSLRDNWYFSFGDAEVGRGLLAFIEYSVPGSLFERDRIWVYDCRKREYIIKKELKRTGGHIYAFFSPERFTGDFALWSEKLAP